MRGLTIRINVLGVFETTIFQMFNALFLTVYAPSDRRRYSKERIFCHCSSPIVSIMCCVCFSVKDRISSSSEVFCKDFPDSLKMSLPRRSTLLSLILHVGSKMPFSITGKSKAVEVVA
uniref:Uncharacterized protein n=1 Tax=Chloropicon primus TaxID=1764295 RepID=A0A7S2X1H2_9CHLO